MAPIDFRLLKLVHIFVFVDWIRLSGSENMINVEPALEFDNLPLRLMKPAGTDRSLTRGIRTDASSFSGRSGYVDLIFNWPRFV